MRSVKVLGIISIILLSSIVLFLFAQRNSQHPKTVTIKEHTFFIKIAKTQSEREKGLSGISSLPEGEGMLFIFDKPGFYYFWMKDMKFSIDIIFIRENKIVTIVKNVKVPELQSLQNLPTYTSSKPSDKILEISCGLSKKYNFSVGDSVQITL